MNRNRFSIVGMLMVTVIFASGCLNKESIPINPADETTGEHDADVQVAMKGNTGIAKEAESKKYDPPALKNLGINIAPWNHTTNRGGDFVFERKYAGSYFKNKIFSEFGDVAVDGATGKEKLIPEIGFNVPVGTKLISPIDGIVYNIVFYEPSQDYLIGLKTDIDSPWIVGFEHIENVSVAEGSEIAVGQELARVSPSYGNNEHGNVEISVFQGGEHIIKFCPSLFLDKSVKQAYEEKLIQLAKDWEDLIGSDVYNSEKWIAPGCFSHNITER